MNDKQYSEILTQLTRIADALTVLASTGIANGSNPTGEEISFPAEQLVPEVLDGKRYWKVKGGQYRKHGVRIWPEGMQTAGFDADTLEIRSYDLTGYTAYAIANDSGNPAKVTRLVREGGLPENPPAQTAGRTNGNGRPTPEPEPVRAPVADSTDGGELMPEAVNDYITYWQKIVPHYKLERSRARDILKRCGDDALKAYEMIVAEAGA